MGKANEVLTIIELARYLRIPRATAYKLAQQGRIPCQKVGRHWRFRKEAVDRWLERQDHRIASA
jgi:excisionase family DNA binding protein